MKPLTHLGLLAVVALVSCQQSVPDFNPQGDAPSRLKETHKLGQYLALPGQAAVNTKELDPDAAFDRQAAEYARNRQAAATPGGDAGFQPPAMDPTPGAVNHNHREQVNIPEPAAQEQAPAAPEPVHITPAAPPAQPSQLPPPAEPKPTVNLPTAHPSGQLDYTVSISNKTSGQLFIEAQDSAGTIYPCGPMSPNKTWNTPMTKADPIKWPIVVVVRDPDQPGAPEIRRYRVNTPVDYTNRTLNISIVPGGKYEVRLDDQLFYVSPVES